MEMKRFIFAGILGLSLAERGGKLVNLLVSPVLRRADVEVLTPYREQGVRQ